MYPQSQVVDGCKFLFKHDSEMKKECKSDQPDHYGHEEMSVSGLLPCRDLGLGDKRCNCMPWFLGCWVYSGAHLKTQLLSRTWTDWGDSDGLPAWLSYVHQMLTEVSCEVAFSARKEDVTPLNRAGT